MWRYAVVGAVVVSAGLLGTARADAAPAAGAARAAHDAGWVRLAHLSPNTPPVDVYLYNFGDPKARLVLRHVAYGMVSPYEQLPAGDYTVSMRAAGAKPATKPVLSTAFWVTGGDAYTVAGMGPAYEAKIDRGRAAERRWRETGESEVIPAVGADGGDVAMPLREAYEFYGTPRGAVPNYVNGYAVQSLAYSLPFDAHRAAGEIEVPVLIVHSDNALAPDLTRTFYGEVRSPKSDLWLDSQGQIDFYDDPKLIAPAADAVDAFLRTLA